MKIVFLDIDGVLNHEKFYKDFHFNKIIKAQHRKNNIDPRSAKLVVDLCKQTGAKIVISSSLRFDGLDELTKRLRIAGIKDKYVLDVCSLERPHEFSGTNRGTVIQRYIDEHNIDKYIILDDDTDMLEHQKPYFIKISRWTGFTEVNLKTAINILKN